MVFGWRKAFCTSVPKEAEPDSGGGATPKFGVGFGFFSSNPSTPRLQSESDSSPSLHCRTTIAAVAEKSALSPKLHCKTSKSPRLFQWSSTPSSPRSPSTFSLLKSNLRLSTVRSDQNRCGLCLQSVKRGRGVAIFTAECSHGFHFPCIAGHVKNKGNLACPICGTIWKQMPLLSVNDQNQNQNQFVEEIEKTRENIIEKKNYRKHNSFRPDLKVYDDDEPLASLTPKARFNPIPESDENCEEDSIGEFQGFHIDSNTSVDVDIIDVDIRLLPEVAVVSTSRSYETYAVVLKVKAPAIPKKTQNRAPIDLVTVIDVSGKMSKEKLQMMKRAMKLIISSLSSSDRLSIVAFSSYSKRLLPLKRMTTNGQRAARRIVEAMAVLEGSSNANDAVKKAVKVLEDRREKNTVASIILLSDHSDQTTYVSSTRYSHSHSQSHLDVAVHSVKLTAIESHAFTNSVKSLLNVVVQDLQLQLGFISGSAPGEIAAVYSYSPRPVTLGSGMIRIEELCVNEERELLIELKVPSSAVGAHQVLSVRCSYRESVTREVINCKQHALVVPRPHTVRSSSLKIQLLKNLFVTTRAIAESRRLTSRNDLIGAYHMLISARSFLHQTSSGSSEFVVSLEAELNELQRRRQTQAYLDEKGEPLTPTSAWRVAEKLAKVAIMRKSLNRVSDLHGFEDARF